MEFDKEKIHELYPEAEDLMYEPMLIWKTEKPDIIQDAFEGGNYFLETKIDGFLEQIVKTPNYIYMFSRAISKTTGLLSEKSDNVPHIKEAFKSLPPNTIIISEIFFPGKTSKDVTSILGCLPAKAIARQKNNPLHLYCHDIIFLNGEDLMNKGAEKRYLILQKLWKECGLAQYEFLHLATKVDTNLEEETYKILNSGGEGVVLKKKDAPYTPGKRPARDTLKIKQKDTIDLVCCGLCEPTKEYTGKDIDTWPYWQTADGSFIDSNCYGIEGCNPVTKYYFYSIKTAIQIGAYDDNGNVVMLGTVSSGLTDEDKIEMTRYPQAFVGKVVTLDCMSINKKEHTLRHPVFREVREDKNPRECTFNEVFK